MAFSSDDAYKLFLIKRTQVEMLADRGFPIPDDENSIFLEDPASQQPDNDLMTRFIRRYTSPENKLFSREEMTQTYVDTNDELTYVYFAPSTTKDKQGVGIVNIFIKSLEDLHADNGIIITSESFTSDAKKSLESLTKPIIQIFFDHQLYANPINNILVPKQTRLTPEERQTFFATSRIKPKDVLAISVDDPIVRYYAWKVGDVIRVDRVNLSTNKTMTMSSIAYRIVTRVRFDLEKKITKAKVTA